MEQTGWPVRFRGALRPSQVQAVEVVRAQLAAGERRLHVVAPPGSGKTVMGLYIWAECVKRPAVVLSPNSAIQAQWAARLDLFDLGPHAPAISTDPLEPGLFTSLTYQSVTLPRRGGDDLDAAAIDLWMASLIDKQQAEDPAEAEAWIADLRRHNRDYYEQRLSAYRKQVRDATATAGEAMSTLHVSSLAALRRLRERAVGLIILDECHHLMGHWGRVLADVESFFDGPIVLGLTATPPDERGKAPADVERYATFFGPIDFEVPVPALVREGHLAPYQDLAHFVRPAAEELRYIAQADEQFAALVADLCEPRSEGAAVPALPQWVSQTLATRRLPTGEVKDWQAFERRDRLFADMGRLFLLQRDMALPPDVPAPAAELIETPPPLLAVLTPVLDRYIRHGLRRSPDTADHALAERAISRLRMLGVQITETGAQPCASPVSRVMAYAAHKRQAVIDILRAEHAVLAERLRAVVVTDYEKTSAVSADVEGVLDEEAGGAIAAFRALLTDPATDALQPVLVTGSTVLVDDDLLGTFIEQANQWLAKRGHEVELTVGHEQGFATIGGRGADWCPRVYVAMITELLQRGVTQCLVGTRGLLGEGWDAHRVNVLIDLTTVTTSMSVNQLRGRSIRLDPDDPNKLADNWDVVCLAGEFSKGLDDYQRFMDKHRSLYGVTDDGAIEKGVGHVHAAFTELEPEGIEGALGVLNTEMLSRAARRDRCRSLWKIGERFENRPVRALEIKRGGGAEGFPPFGGRDELWSDQSLSLAIGRAVLESLREAKLIGGTARIHAGERAGGYVRLFLEGGEGEEAAIFSEAMHEALGPLDRPRYVIPRYVDRLTETWLSRLLPQIVGQYLRKRRRQFAMLHAVPSELAKHKNIVAIYQRHWNLHVSPGEAVYAHHGDGETMVADAKRTGMTPGGRVHEKDVYL